MLENVKNSAFRNVILVQMSSGYAVTSDLHYSAFMDIQLKENCFMAFHFSNVLKSEDTTYIYSYESVSEVK